MVESISFNVQVFSVCLCVCPPHPVSLAVSIMLAFVLSGQYGPSIRLDVAQYSTLPVYIWLVVATSFQSGY